MNVNNNNIRVDKDGALPSAACNIHILLVDHDTTSLMSLESHFQRQFYKVTTTDSAEKALSMLQAGKKHFNIVIANLGLPGMDIYKFVQELHQKHNNIPVILMAEDVTTDLAKEALGNGVSYIFPKPLNHQTSATLWHHIYRLTGEMPSSPDTTYNDIEKYGCSDSAASSQKQRNLITTEIENTKRRKIQIAENLNSSNDSAEEDGSNSKKSDMTWTDSLHQKFLIAVKVLGEQGAQPKTISRFLNDPRLTLDQISSHLQKFRDRKRHFVNRQTTAISVMPTVQPAAPSSIFLQGTSNTATLNYTAAHGAPQIPRSPSWRKPPNFVGYYTLDDVNRILEALNHSGNVAPNATISNGDIQKPEGRVGVQIAPSIDQNHEYSENSSGNIGEQPQVFPHPYVHVTPAFGHNVMLSSDHLSNDFWTPNQEPANATGNVMPASGNLSNGLQALNQESAGDFGMGMCGLENAGNSKNIKNDNSGEGTSANIEFNGMTLEDYANQVLQDFEASLENFDALSD